MENEILRKVQMIQLDILKDVVRVCDENNIKYFLIDGTLLGAVRHQGFIPWDDDIDIGMLREEYDRFCEIAPLELGQQYYLQTWFSDKEYALPFSKVRKKGTTYQEGKAAPLTNNGIYIDVLPFDNAPENGEERIELSKKRVDLCRLSLMKHGVKPWYEGGKVNIKKRIGYLLYQFRALFRTRESIISKFESLVRSVPKGTCVYEEFTAKTRLYPCRKWFEELIELEFEDDKFLCPKDSDSYLTMAFGDYMTPPPESERADRHQIIELDFGE